MCMKFGGVGMIVFGFDFVVCVLLLLLQDLVVVWQLYFDICVEFFGVDCCMFESNFFVDKGMFGYCVLWNVFK